MNSLFSCTGHLFYLHCFCSSDFLRRFLHPPASSIHPLSHSRALQLSHFTYSSISFTLVDSTLPKHQPIACTLPSSDLPFPKTSLGSSPSPLASHTTPTLHQLLKTSTANHPVDVHSHPVENRVSCRIPSSLPVGGHSLRCRASEREGPLWMGAKDP